MRKLSLAVLAAPLLLLGCATTSYPPPEWDAKLISATEAEYQPYLLTGTGSVEGQAFMAQSGGGTVRAAGRTVTLDPATSTGTQWWGKAGSFWQHKAIVPPSPNFVKARRTTMADADGRFKFSQLPAGKYYLRTEVTWNVPYWGVQGGLVGRQIEVKPGETTEVIINSFDK